MANELSNDNRLHQAAKSRSERVTLVVVPSDTGAEASGKEGVVDKQVVITTWDHRESILRALNKKPIPAIGEGALGEPHRNDRGGDAPDVREAVVAEWEDPVTWKNPAAANPSLPEARFLFQRSPTFSIKP